MDKKIHYLFTTITFDEGIDIIKFNSITINKNDVLLEKIIKDILNNKTDDNKIEINNKYSKMILSFDSSSIHYYIEGETNNFIFEDSYLLEDKLNNVIKRKINNNKNENEIENIWNNENIKNINYVIVYEEFYNNSYHNNKINNISVNTYIEFKKILQNEVDKLNDIIGYLFVFYIITNEENIKIRKFENIYKSNPHI
jgi:hypothetical protein